VGPERPDPATLSSGAADRFGSVDGVVVLMMSSCSWWR
jgi:hypothetical protein